MSEDTIYWQNFYVKRCERHAYLYYGKARRSYDLEKQEWIDVDDVLVEEENLSTAADYFQSQEKPTQAQEIGQVIVNLIAYKMDAAYQKLKTLDQKAATILQKAKTIFQGVETAAGESTDLSNKLMTDMQQTLELVHSKYGEVGITQDDAESRKEMPLSEHAAFWQNFYGERCERHAYLYHEKAKQSYNFQTRELINSDAVLYERENLDIAAKYFGSQGKPTLAQEITVVLMASYAHEVETLAQAGKRAMYGEGGVIDHYKKSETDIQEIEKAIQRALYGEVGITEDIDESRKGWTIQDRDLYLELKRLLYKIQDPLDFSFEVMYSPAQFSPPEDQWEWQDLINRQQEKKNLLTALKQVNRVSLYGSLGIGKTTLVAQLWHQEEVLSIFPDGMFWIRSPRTSLEEITDTMAIALRKPSLRVKPLTQQVVEVRRLLEGKKALIVLDEAMSRDEVVTAMECIPPSCTLLVTGSRVRCLQALNGELLLMEPLEPQDAVALFRAWLGVRTRHYDSQVEWEICRLLAYLPLAIELVSRYIAWSHATPQQALSQLRSFRRRFANVDNIALRTALAFCVDQLSDDVVRLLSTLCMLPTNYFALDVIEALSDVDVQACLPVLLDLGLVRFDRSLGYYPLPFLPDMVSVRSLQRNKVADDDMWVRLSNFLQAYLATNAQDFGRFERVHELLSWMIERHSKQEASAQIIQSVRLMIPFLMASGYWTDLAKALGSGIRSARLLDDRATLAHFRHQLALLCYHGEQDELALKLFQENVDLLRDLKDWSTLSLALYAMGVLYEQGGDFQSARAAYQQTLELSLQESAIYIHASYRLGKLEFQRNDFQAARRAFQTAYNAVRQLSS